MLTLSSDCVGDVTVSLGRNGWFIARERMATRHDVLAVSPEGVVRYWPSIAQEGTSTEISTELGGQ